MRSRISRPLEDRSGALCGVRVFFSEFVETRAACFHEFVEKRAACFPEFMETRAACFPEFVEKRARLFISEYSTKCIDVVSNVCFISEYSTKCIDLWYLQSLCSSSSCFRRESAFVRADAEGSASRAAPDVF